MRCRRSLLGVVRILVSLLFLLVYFWCLAMVADLLFQVVILAVVDFETYRDCVVSGLEQYRRLCGVGGMRSEGDEELNLPW